MRQDTDNDDYEEGNTTRKSKKHKQKDEKLKQQLAGRSRTIKKQRVQREDKQARLDEKILIRQLKKLSQVELPSWSVNVSSDQELQVTVEEKQIAIDQETVQVTN